MLTIYTHALIKSATFCKDNIFYQYICRIGNKLQPIFGFCTECLGEYAAIAYVFPISHTVPFVWCYAYVYVVMRVVMRMCMVLLPCVWQQSALLAPI